MMTSSLCGGVSVPTALRDVQRPFRITTDGGMSQKPNRTKPDTQFKARAAPPKRLQIEGATASVCCTRSRTAPQYRL